MVTLNTVAQEGGIETIVVCGIKFISQSDGILFVNSSRRLKTQILGIERFIVIDDSVVPDMDHIADFSSLTDYEESALESLIFIQSLPKNANALLDFTLSQDF